jgi:DNA topoisomerase III
MITNKPVYAEIEKALKNATEIILGADPDREGELIHRNILEIAKENGAVKPIKITRIWLHSETAPEIKRLSRQGRIIKEFDGYYNAARTREIVDWLVGIQLTILYSVKYGKPGKPVSIGRVQTWLLAEIIKRFIENRDFKPEPFRTFFSLQEKVLFSI